MNHNMTYRETKETPQEYLPIMEDLRDPTPTPVVNVTPTTVEAGKSTFTVANNKGEHYTFMVTKKDPEPGTRWVAYGPSWFVALLTGPNNDQDYTYMGVLNHAADTMYVYLTKASKFNPDSKPVQVFDFAMRVICGVQSLPNGYSIQHDGTCAKCHRKLTDPTSLEIGLGPVCRGDY